MDTVLDVTGLNKSYDSFSLKDYGYGFRCNWIKQIL